MSAKRKLSELSALRAIRREAGHLLSASSERSSWVDAKIARIYDLASRALLKEGT